MTQDTKTHPSAPPMSWWSLCQSEHWRKHWLMREAWVQAGPSSAFNQKEKLLAWQIYTMDWFFWVQLGGNPRNFQHPGSWEGAGWEHTESSGASLYFLPSVLCKEKTEVCRCFFRCQKDTSLDSFNWERPGIFISWYLVCSQNPAIDSLTLLVYTLWKCIFCKCKQ